MNNVELLSREDEIELARRALAGDIEARNRVVMNLYPWIFRRAKVYAQRMAHEDLVQHAIRMCVEKFHHFDPSFNVRPMTFLCHIAERQMQKLTKMDGVIMPPSGMAKDASKETKERAKFARRSISLSMQLAPDEDEQRGTIENTFADQRAIPPECGAMLNEDREYADSLLKLLTPRDRKIVQLCVMEEMTLEEVGKICGITRERVRQIKERAMKAIHRRARRSGKRR